MSRSIPFLAISVVILSLSFAVSPALTSDFAGFKPTQFPVVQEFWPIQPAGWAFGIWGVIYLWLILGAFWGLRYAAVDPAWQAFRKPLLISLGIGTFWVEAASRSPVLATVMIFLMAVTSIFAFLRAGPEVPGWQVRPIALYSGWLTAATGVGIGVVLSGYGVMSPKTAALVMLIAVLMAALLVQSRRPAEWAYPAAVIWALIGVIAANVTPENWTIIALAAAGILALISRFFLVNRRPRLPQ